MKSVSQCGQRENNLCARIKLNSSVTLWYSVLPETVRSWVLNQLMTKILNIGTNIIWRLVKSPNDTRMQYHFCPPCPRAIDPFQRLILHPLETHLSGDINKKGGPTTLLGGGSYKNWRDKIQSEHHLDPQVSCSGILVTGEAEGCPHYHGCQDCCHLAALHGAGCAWGHCLRHSQLQQHKHLHATVAPDFLHEGECLHHLALWMLWLSAGDLDGALTVFVFSFADSFCKPPKRLQTQRCFL